MRTIAVSRDIVRANNNAPFTVAAHGSTSYRHAINIERHHSISGKTATGPRNRCTGLSIVNIDQRITERRAHGQGRWRGAVDIDRNFHLCGIAVRIRRAQRPLAFALGKILQNVQRNGHRPAIARPRHGINNFTAHVERNDLPFWRCTRQHLDSRRFADIDFAIGNKTARV